MLKNLRILGLIAMLFFAGCVSDEDDGQKGTQAKGGVYYGGVFRYNEIEPFKSFYPLFCTLALSWRIADQMYEGLVDLDQTTLDIKAVLAESWDYDPETRVYTFHIRKGVMFHDNACFSNGKGREMTANDFKYSMDMLCTADPLNQGFDFTFKNRVAGATEYYESTMAGTP
ncbi:MAG: ABC transporter substrate-binding protein, partial [Bacteroidetes bacterium]|nr:ABC transporter substrate-binding protein [Bacteroidota bacterium]